MVIAIWVGSSSGNRGHPNPLAWKTIFSWLWNQMVSFGLDHIMADNYTKIVLENLNRLYGNLPYNLADTLPGVEDGNQFIFTAFGRECRIAPDMVSFSGDPADSVLGILISLYALHARPDPCIVHPLKSFKEFPDTMPYIGAFTTHTEHLLIPHVDKIKSSITRITSALNGQVSSHETGDFGFIVHPLPKIALCYIFYEADEDFPASVTCLFSNNARLFLPVDGLADVGEYCSKTILHLADAVA